MNNGHKLIVLRSDKGYTQKQVATMLNISESNYRKMENGELRLSSEEFKKIFQIYNIDEKYFSSMKFPITRTISFPKEMLDQLENTIEENRKIPDNWEEKQNRLKILNEALEPILKRRDDFLDFPSFNLNSNPVPTEVTIKKVTLDLRGENLIDECIALSNIYLKSMQSN